MKQLTTVTKALSDPNRLAMLKLLESRELCVCELQACLGLAQPTISQHLKVLERAGLVASSRQGSWMIYRLDGDQPYAREMLALCRGWLNDEPHITALLAKLPAVSRHEICCQPKANQNLPD